MVGDWMGSQYDVGGRRYDYRLFLDHDGHYERIVRHEPDYERRDSGRWLHDEAQGVLRLESDSPDDTDRMSSSWWVLSVRTCEDSNCILVLRWVAFASRNLPVLFYRVHCDGRGYGTGWEQRLAEQGIGIGVRVAPEPLPHHLACGSALGGSILGSKRLPDP